MSQRFLDPTSYTFAGGFTIPSGRDLIIPDSLVLAQTMLVKWQVRQLAKGVTLDQIPPATLSASLEIAGLGILNHADYQILPSQQGRDVVQLLTIDPTLPHQIKLSQVSDLVTNSILELYTSSITMGDFNNPVNVSNDFSPLIAAVTAASAAGVAATQAQTAAANKRVLREEDLNYTATVWSNRPTNHIAVNPDPTRMGGSFYNNGTKPLAIDKFVDIGTKTPASQADGLLQPGGIYTFKAEEAGMGYLIYALTPGGTNTVAINLEYPTAAPAPPAVSA